MNVFKHTLKCAFIYCLFFITFANLSSYIRGGNKPIIEVCSDSKPGDPNSKGWCSVIFYLEDEEEGVDNGNHLLATINLNGPGVSLISQEEALERLEEAFSSIELSIISNLESREYPPSGDKLPEDLED